MLAICSGPSPNGENERGRTRARTLTVKVELPNERQKLLVVVVRRQEPLEDRHLHKVCSQDIVFVSRYFFEKGKNL